MLNIVKKSISPARLHSLRGVAKNLPLTMMARHQSSLLVPHRTDFNDFERGLPSLFNNLLLQPRELKKTLSIDFYETKNEYHIDCDVPGFKMDEVKVEWDNDFLVIQAEHSEGEAPLKEKEEVRYHISERSQSQTQLYRKLRMPSDANMEEVSAKFNHGILSIEAPKFETAKKEILVSSGD